MMRTILAQNILHIYSSHFGLKQSCALARNAHLCGINSACSHRARLAETPNCSSLSVLHPENLFASSISRKVWVFIFIVVAALIPQLAVAAESSGLRITSFSPPATDLSVALLGRIFGTVGGGLSAPSATIFGQMFYVFNSGILIVVGFILIYTTFKSVMEIAHGDASQMARKFSWWQVARVVLGAGIVVPQATGYSVINTIVMWVVLQGVGLADAVWSQAIDYLSKGGALYAVATNSTSTLLNIDPQLVFMDHTAAVEGECKKSGNPGCVTGSDVLSAQVCMNYLYNVVEASRQERLKDMAEHPADYTDEEKAMLPIPIARFTETYDEGKNKWTVTFPGNADKVLPPHKDFLSPLQLGEERGRNLNGKCGIYTWGIVPGAKDGEPGTGPGTPADRQNYRDAKEAGLRQMILGLNQIADDSANLYKDKDTVDFPQSLQETTYTSLVNTAANYQSIILPMRLHASNHYLPEKEETINPGVFTKEGWIDAGSFYFRLGTLKERVGKIDEYYYAAINEPSPRCSGSGYGKQCNTRTDEIFGLFKEYLPSTSGDYQVKLKDRLLWHDDATNTGSTIFARAQALAAMLNEAAKVEGGIKDLPEALAYFAKSKSVYIRAPAPVMTWAGQLIVLKPLNKYLNGVVEQWYGGLVSKSTEFPMLRVRDLGLAMVAGFLSFWQHVLHTLSGILAGYFAYSLYAMLRSAAAALTTIFGVGIGFQEFIHFEFAWQQFLMKIFVEMPVAMLLPLAGAASVLLLVNGVVLAYYIPLLPFMLFLFGVISWFSFVIEAMVAAPLVALGITHPEGQHDLLGKSEHALMLLTSVFVRPTIMIFGLLAGMVLSYVAMDVLNAGFGRVVGSIYFFNPSDALYQVQNLAMILIYTLITMSLMQQCFSLIHVLPSAIHSWIGAPGRPEMEAQYAAEVKGGVSGAAERVGPTAEATAKGISPGAVPLSEMGGEGAGKAIGLQAKKKKEKGKPSMTVGRGDNPEGST